MDSGSFKKEVSYKIPDRNRALDSLANQKPIYQSEATETSRSDAVDGESMSSQKFSSEIKEFSLMSIAMDSREANETVLESFVGRKQYECRKCGQPLKGHVCSYKSGFRIPDQKKSQMLQRRYRRRSLATLSEGEPTAHTVVNRGGDILWNTDDESSWEEDRDAREVWSKKNTNKILPSSRSVGLGSKRRRNGKRRRLSLSDDFDADNTGTESPLLKKKVPPQLSNSGKRVYLCRKCGVPRKGHICLHDSVQNRNAPFAENEMPAHILTEEIRLYLQTPCSANQSNISQFHDLDTEKKLLLSWASNVNYFFSKVKEPSGTSTQCMDKTKFLTKSINKERDALIALRSKIRQIQNDSRILDERVAELRQENIAFVGASNFLNAIDALR